MWMTFKLRFGKVGPDLRATRLLQSVFSSGTLYPKPSINRTSSLPCSTLPAATWRSVLLRTSLAPCLPIVWVLSLLLIFLSIAATLRLQKETICPQGVRCDPPLSLVHSSLSEHNGSGVFRLAIFTYPQPFEGIADFRQRRAISSWLQQTPIPLVTLLGHHPSLLQVASQYAGQVIVDDNVDTSFQGIPLFHSVIGRARAASADVAIVVPPDLILLQDVSNVMEKMRQAKGDWLIVSASWHLEDFPFEAKGHSWRQTRRPGDLSNRELSALVRERGTLDPCRDVDLLAWNTSPTPLHAGITPPFLVGVGSNRSYNHWLLNEAVESGLRRVIDASQALTAVHPSVAMDLAIAGAVGNRGAGVIRGSATARSPAAKHRRGQGEVGVQEAGTAELPWMASVNAFMAASYGSYGLRRRTMSDVPILLIPCGEIKPTSLCFLTPATCNCSDVPSSVPAEIENADLAHVWEGQLGGGVAREEFVKAQAPDNPGEGRDRSAHLRGVDAIGKPVKSSSRWLWGPWSIGRKNLAPPAASQSDSRGSNRCDCTSWTAPFFGELKGEPACAAPRMAPSGELSRHVLLPYSLKELLEQVAGKERLVVLAVVAQNYSEMLMSWVCSLRRLRLFNFLVLALDEEVYRLAVMQGLAVFRLQTLTASANRIEREHCHFGTLCFQHVTKVKSRQVAAILRLGYHVLFSDVDVYWFQNPIPELLAFGPGHLLVQSDNWNDTGPDNAIRRLNSGFYLARAEPASILAFDEVVKHAAASALTEQPSFYDVLCGVEGEYRVGTTRCLYPLTNLTIQFLDRTRYPNGASWLIWENDTRSRCLRQGCMVLHNNWVNGRSNKLKRQLKQGLWDYDMRSRTCVQPWQNRNSDRVF